MLSPLAGPSPPAIGLVNVALAVSALGTLPRVQSTWAPHRRIPLPAAPPADPVQPMVTRFRKVLVVAPPLLAVLVVLDPFPLANSKAALQACVPRLLLLDHSKPVLRACAPAAMPSHNVAHISCTCAGIPGFELRRPPQHRGQQPVCSRPAAEWLFPRPTCTWTSRP